MNMMMLGTSSPLNLEPESWQVIHHGDPTAKQDQNGEEYQARQQQRQQQPQLQEVPEETGASMAPEPSPRPASTASATFANQQERSSDLQQHLEHQPQPSTPELNTQELPSISYPSSLPVTSDAQVTELSPPQHNLQSKASTSSISSTSSTSSTTTTQTFMSTLSFSTVTGAHHRTLTQDQGGKDFDDEEGVMDEEDDRVEVGSVDVEIHTPKDSEYYNPFALHQREQTVDSKHEQQPGQQDHQRQGSLQSNQRQSRTSPSSSFAPELKGHVKMASQQSNNSSSSSGARTISVDAHEKKQRSVEALSFYAPGSPSELSISSMDRQLMEYNQATSSSTEEMLFASPEYRKSLTLSERSDLAMESSSLSERGSSAYVAETSQYSNLLWDATLIIDQQQQAQQQQVQGSIDIVGEHSQISEVEANTLWNTNRNKVAQVSTAESSSIAQRSEGSSRSRASKDSTLMDPRSRRFSAPGYHGSDHVSVSSTSSSTSRQTALRRQEQQSVSSVKAAAGVRGPQSVMGHIRSSQQPSEVIYEGDDICIVGNGERSGGKLSSFCDGEGDEDTPKNTVHQSTMHHHPTMPAFLFSSNDSPTPSAGPMYSTIATPLPVTTSQYQQYQAHMHHHDYRPGVVFEYYEGEWDWLPNFEEMRPDHAGIVGNFMIDDTTERDLFQPQFSFDDICQQQNPLQAGQRQRRRVYKETGNFAVRFSTHIDITQDGVHSFWLSSNDGSVLYIDNSLVVENDGQHYATEAEGRMMLQVGKHAMVVEFFHRNGKMLEGFRSTGPSLSVCYRVPGPIWSFGLKAGPKRVVKSSNLSYDYGDVRIRNLLLEFGVEDDYSSMGNTHDCLSPDGSKPEFVGRSSIGGDGMQHGRQNSGQYQHHYQDRPGRHRVVSGDMGQMQPSNRELMVQMENAKTTIKDLEQIIRDQADAHQTKMNQLYGILQDTQAQVDRLVLGLKKATLFEKVPSKQPTPADVMSSGYRQQRRNGLNPNLSWRNTVVSVYVDAEEDYPVQEDDQDGGWDRDGTDAKEATGGRGNGNENVPDGDSILEKHLADVEKLKQLYFFSMALSVKMNSEMMGRRTTEYTSSSVQKLYEDCTMHSKIPVEGWPGYVGRHFSKRPASLSSQTQRAQT
ncbi:hypothetical protein BG011_008986 [Mortierella polycephala]|uniref:PA14 domain-containing protein n=1 Tax=Mortierella polycephala TaxID=41804 RepID=A0A9P6PM10_9FUNG|nr:hypothetical protein BG011_008986 [Mortierella polycephala]